MTWFTGLVLPGAAELVARFVDTLRPPHTNALTQQNPAYPKRAGVPEHASWLEALRARSDDGTPSSQHASPDGAGALVCAPERRRGGREARRGLGSPPQLSPQTARSHAPPPGT